MSILSKLFTDTEPLSPQAATGCLICSGAFFVWAAISLFLAATGKTFAYYDAMTAGAFTMIGAGAGLLGYHLNQTKGSETNNGK